MLQALHQGTTVWEYLHQRQEQVQERAGLRMLGRAVATLALAFVTSISPVSARWCIEPSKPFCLDIGQPDDWCRSEVEQFLAREKEFRDCLVDEANQRIEESKRRSKQVVEKWNCYAKGNSFCL
jgi:hypothetical protein